MNETIIHISQEGGTPLMVSENERIMGVIHLKDIVKPGIADRFAFSNELEYEQS